MEHRNVVAFNFVRRQSETSLMACAKAPVSDYNANLLKSRIATSRGSYDRAIGRSMTFTPRDTQTHKHTGSKRITLPERFRQKLRSTRGVSEHTVMTKADSFSSRHGASVEFKPTNEQGRNCIEESSNSNWSEQKRDVEQALFWLKQELANMREQDRILNKRFSDLRVLIQETQGIRSCPTLESVFRSNISLSSSSCLSLDDGRLPETSSTSVLLHKRILFSPEHKRRALAKHHTHQLVITPPSPPTSHELIISHSDSDLRAKAISLSNMTPQTPPLIARMQRPSLAEAESVEEDSEEEYTIQERSNPSCFRINGGVMPVHSRDSSSSSSIGSDFSVDSLLKSEYTATLT